MKWADLGELILKLNPQELNLDVMILVNNDVFGGDYINLLINKNERDELDDGHPYLEVISKPLESIIELESKFEEGQAVHVDTDSEEWGQRVCGDGTIVEVKNNECLIDICGFEGGTRLIVPNSDISIMEQ